MHSHENHLRLWIGHMVCMFLLRLKVEPCGEDERAVRLSDENKEGAAASI